MKSTKHSKFNMLRFNFYPLGDAKRNQALTRNREGFFVVGQICPTRCPTDSEKFCSDSANLRFKELDVHRCAILTFSFHTLTILNSIKHGFRSLPQIYALMGSTILDKWDLRLGADLRFFMEQRLSSAHLALCICSEAYVKWV